MTPTENEIIKHIDFLREIDRGLALLREQNARMIAELTPKEAAILERRFSDQPKK